LIFRSQPLTEHDSYSTSDSRQVKTIAGLKEENMEKEEKEEKKKKLFGFGGSLRRSGF
jgi:hypothetical protein